MNNFTDYELLNRQLKAMFWGITYDITVLANASALIYEALGDLNWCGFYILKDGSLKLGPFQGKAACAEIKIGKGVCGTAAEKGQTQLVPDVHLFPGHIACDSASNSEIVVPLYTKDGLYGVLDIDSPVLNRFTQEDKAGLEAVARIVEKALSCTY